jgi:hypothetical protein
MMRTNVTPGDKVTESMTASNLSAERRLLKILIGKYVDIGPKAKIIIGVVAFPLF